MRGLHGRHCGGVPRSPPLNRAAAVPEKLLPFLLFMFVGAVTPGPNNMIGVMIGRLLADDRRRRIFQYALAALLALSIVFLFV